jgi:hypothetical protein
LPWDEEGDLWWDIYWENGRSCEVGWYFTPTFEKVFADFRPNYNLSLD